MTATGSEAGLGRPHLRVQSSRPFDVAEAVASASASSGLPAPIIEELISRAGSTIADRVRRNKHTGVLETNLAGMPGFSVSSTRGTTRIEWVSVGVANRQAVEIMAPAGGLTVTDMMLLTHLSTSYIRLGCPADRTVPFSLNNLASTLGYAKAGGRTLELVEASLHRLMSVTIRMQLRVGRVVGRAEWHLLDRRFTVSRGSRGMGGVRLSEDYASLVGGGNVTFLDMRLVGAIADRPRIGDIATRLYFMFEAQQGPGLRPWRFPVFPTDEPGGPLGAYSPLVELLGLTDRKRYRIRAKIGAAMSAIEAVDPRYVGQLEPARRDGQFNLVVRRGSPDSGGARPRTSRVHTPDSGGRPPDRQPPATSSFNVEDKRPAGRERKGAGTAPETAPNGAARRDAAASRKASKNPPSTERPAEPTTGESEFRRKTRLGLSPELQADWGLLD
jgi:hypothetical protein